MIAYLEGVVREALPNRLIINVQGVGYLVHIPLGTYDALHPAKGQNISLETYLHVRENIMDLYGFGSSEEKDLFLLLINRVSGIGPSTALSILSGMPPSQFKSAVVNADLASLSSIKGLGKKTAERIVLELKDKIGVTETWGAANSEKGTGPAQDAELALISLGYKQAEARKSVTQAIKAQPESNVDDLIRLALRGLS